MSKYIIKKILTVLLFLFILPGVSSALKEMRPSTPDIIHATPSDGRILVNWDYSKKINEKIDGYIIRYGTTSGIYKNKIDTTNKMFKITGLDNGVTYYFVVQAIKKDGKKIIKSYASHEIKATPESISVDLLGVSVNPSVLYADGVSMAKIAVKAINKNKQGVSKALIKFEITEGYGTLMNKNCITEENGQCSVLFRSNKFTETGITKIKVSYKEALLLSERTLTIKTVPKHTNKSIPPSKILLRPFNDGILLSWVPPYNKQLEGYNIYMTTDLKSVGFSPITTTPILGESFFVSGLEPNREYAFVVTAINAGEESRNSVVVLGKVSEGDTKKFLGTKEIISFNINDDEYIKDLNKKANSEVIKSLDGGINWLQIIIAILAVLLLGGYYLMERNEKKE